MSKGKCTYCKKEYEAINTPNVSTLEGIFYFCTEEHREIWLKTYRKLATEKAHKLGKEPYFIERTW